MKFEILTIFPEFFRGPLEHGIVRQASEAGLITVSMHDLRAFTRYGADRGPYHWG